MADNIYQVARDCFGLAVIGCGLYHLLGLLTRGMRP